MRTHQLSEEKRTGVVGYAWATPTIWGYIAVISGIEYVTTDPLSTLGIRAGDTVEYRTYVDGVHARHACSIAKVAPQDFSDDLRVSRFNESLEALTQLSAKEVGLERNEVLNMVSSANHDRDIVAAVLDFTRQASLSVVVRPWNRPPIPVLCY